MNRIEKKGSYSVSFKFTVCENKYKYQSVLKSDSIRTCNRITL